MSNTTASLIASKLAAKADPASETKNETRFTLALTEADYLFLKETAKRLNMGVMAFAREIMEISIGETRKALAEADKPKVAPKA